MEYKVKVIKILLKNNKTAKAGETVKGHQLVDEKTSVKNGLVEKIEEKKAKKLNADEIIKLIEAANSLEEISQYKDDDRKTVQSAYAEKLEELESK